MTHIQWWKRRRWVEGKRRSRRRRKKKGRRVEGIGRGGERGSKQENTVTQHNYCLLPGA